jgi:hypothetical protein
MSTNGWKYFFQVSMDLSGSFTGASREKVWLPSQLAGCMAAGWKYPHGSRKIFNMGA